MNLVLVDDDIRTRAAVARSLRARGHDVHELGDAEQIVEVVRQRRPDAVVLDVSLPGTSGIEACELLRLEPDLARTPVVMLSGHDTWLAFQQATAAGADRYLVKPVEPARLLEVLTTCPRAA